MLKALKLDFPRSNTENTKSNKREKPRNPIGTPGAFSIYKKFPEISVFHLGVRSIDPIPE